MKYISATKGALITLPLFTILVLLDPVRIDLPSVEIILTISTFLFAIMSGFYISRLDTRYDQLRSLVASEDAHILSLYKIAQLFGAPFAKRIANHIDLYLISSYDFPISHYAYKNTAQHYLALWDEARTIKSQQPQTAYQNFLGLLANMEHERNTSSTVAAERLSIAQWAMLILLAINILVSMFGLLTPNWYIQLSIILFASILVLIILLIRDLQNLMIGQTALLEESGQEVLEFIGKKRYYQQVFLDNGMSRVPSHVKEYRLGIHEPGAKKIKIKVVKN